jgi:CubicO group peptidase (beta-lactamase class C family)
VTKSVFTTLFGIAQDQGLVNVNQKLYDLYPEYRSKSGWDPKKNDITLGMLLCMDSGFACDNLADSCATDIYKTHDWLGYTLSLPLNHVPGQHWTYNGTSLIPISNWIAEKSGMSIADYAQKYLEGPLGIQPHYWETGPNGITRVDASHYMTPREMLKLGVLYLNNGKWNGKRIVSKKWVAQATIPQAAKDQTRNFEYGYLFWLKSMTFGKRTVPIIEANGWGGQYIFIVPDFDLVCVMTAGNYQMGSFFTMEEDFFKKYVMAAFYKKNWREKLTSYFQ